MAADKNQEIAMVAFILKLTPILRQSLLMRNQTISNRLANVRTSTANQIASFLSDSNVTFSTDSNQQPLSQLNFKG